jgi:NAD(P)H-quinone oxidoreductase subunit 5
MAIGEWRSARRAGVFEDGAAIAVVGLVPLALAGWIWQWIDARPWSSLGLTLDRVSASIGLLIALVGAVVYRFAWRYLDGEPHQRSFLRWMVGTVLAAYLLVHASNLIVLFVAWSATSLGLHRLLTFYRHPAALMPARKKFLISRIGDGLLLGAIGLIAAHWGTIDLERVLAQPQAPSGWAPAPGIVAVLLVAAALTKSAQVPFHTWLPETLEAPTPVSALMHAGLINGGGVLLLHFAPLLNREPAALIVLTLVGSLTTAVGVLAMWAQPADKRILAWSTVSQMGFMMVQLGLAMAPAALLHLLGHGAYKARAFLRASGVPPRLAPARPLAPWRALLLALAGSLASGWLLARGDAFGTLVGSSPGKLALTAIIALSLGQLWPIIMQLPRRNPMLPLIGIPLVTIGGAWMTTALYAGAAAFFAPVLGAVPNHDAPWAWFNAAVPLVVTALLVVLHPFLGVIAAHPRGHALVVHARYGFYLGIIADRLVARIWPANRRGGE